jgi:hypothetical protein
VAAVVVVVAAVVVVVAAVVVVVAAVVVVVAAVVVVVVAAVVATATVNGQRCEECHAWVPLYYRSLQLSSVVTVHGHFERHHLPTIGICAVLARNGLKRLIK